MTRNAYLTIDDSPTRETDALVDWLAARDIPATFFCIGGAYKDMHIDCEGIEQNPGPILRAIDRGFLIGNHTYTHRRASEMSFDDVVAEIEKTETIIDGLYAQVRKTRPVKLLRFPHIDRGAGGWIVDYDAAGNHKSTLMELFGSGLNITLAPPTAEQIDKKEKIQAYLKREGFVTDIYDGITFPWYQGEMKSSRDLLYTFSTSDWMLNPDLARYAALWPYKTVDALKGKIDADLWLRDETSTHLILAHDHNGLLPVTTALFDYFIKSGINFIAPRV